MISLYYYKTTLFFKEAFKVHFCVIINLKTLKKKRSEEFQHGFEDHNWCISFEMEQQTCVFDSSCIAIGKKILGQKDYVWASVMTWLCSDSWMSWYCQGKGEFGEAQVTESVWNVEWFHQERCQPVQPWVSTVLTTAFTCSGKGIMIS